tara:strand:- start:173 stop:343 length:171 start_codon:yes stop_codon:yes gene_type:complete
MKYFQIDVTWTSGYHHTYCVDEKIRLTEKQKLDQYTHLKDYNITEIDEINYKKFKK